MSPEDTQGPNPRRASDEAPRLIALEPFTAPCASLDWRVGHDYWRRRGVTAFNLHEVPNGSTNDGVRAARAARLLFDNLREADDADALDRTIVVAEYGMGNGMFARLALDTLKRICEQTGADYYQRLRWYATEHSPTTLQGVADSGLLEPHRDVAQLGLASALDLQHIQTLDGRHVTLERVHAFFFNYILDVLPFTIVMRQGDQWFEQRVQTRILDAEFARRLTGLGPADLQRAAREPDAASSDTFARIAPLLDVERAWFPADIDAIDTEGHIRAFVQQVLEPWADVNDALGTLRIAWPIGATQALQTAVRLLHPWGFVLVGDFGWTRREQTIEAGDYPRFCVSTAIGLNFPLLDLILAERTDPRVWVAVPTDDDIAPMHTRLYSLRPLDQSADTLRDVFNGSALHRYEDLLQSARKAATEGRGDDADQLYAALHTLAPESWTVLAEWAGLQNLAYKNHTRAIDLARQALAINPVTSSTAWNELGDALYALGDRDGAHDAYLRAAHANPEHPRSWLNLAWTWTAYGDLDQALNVVHRAILLDRIGTYTQNLIDVQTEILNHRVNHHEKIQSWIMRRQP